jgi:excisionase family DNA binding protein
MSENALLTIDEVAQALGVPHLTVYRLIKSGRLRALRVGKIFRVRRVDMAHYVQVRSAGTG